MTTRTNNNNGRDYAYSKDTLVKGPQLFTGMHLYHKIAQIHNRNSYGYEVLLCSMTNEYDSNSNSMMNQ